VTSWEVCRIIFNVTFSLTDVEGIVDKRKWPVRKQVQCIVLPILVDVLNAEGSDLSMLAFPRCLQEVDVLCREKKLLAC